MGKLRTSIYVLLLVSFGLLCYFAYQFACFPGDITISLWLQGIDLLCFKRLMQAASYISSLIPAIIIVALVVLGLWVSGKKLEAIFIASLTSSAALFNWLIKLLVSRPRPTTEPSGLSFPSGHTTYAIVFYGILFYLAPRLVKQPAAKRAIQSVLMLLIILTGLSRIYLGAHWPSDVFGSLVLGGLLLAPAIALYHRKLGDKNAGAA